MAESGSHYLSAPQFAAEEWSSKNHIGAELSRGRTANGFLCDSWSVFDLNQIIVPPESISSFPAG
jgi:hypothetical protein